MLTLAESCENLSLMFFRWMWLRCEVPCSIKAESDLISKKCDSKYRTKLLDCSRCLFVAKQSCFAARITKIRLIDQPEKDTKPRADFFSHKLPFQTVMKDPRSTCCPCTSSEICNWVFITWQGLMGVKSHPWLFVSPFNSFQMPPRVSSTGSAYSSPLGANTQRAFQGNEQIALGSAEITAPYSVVIDVVIQSIENHRGFIFLFVFLLTISVWKAKCDTGDWCLSLLVNCALQSGWNVSPLVSTQTHTHSRTHKQRFN